MFFLVFHDAETLSFSHIQVEIRPAPGRKRPHEDVEVVEVRWHQCCPGAGFATRGVEFLLSHRDFTEGVGGLLFANVQMHFQRIFLLNIG